ncbi:unnamed protein product [Fraxinus pennsylvanica]|uniref:Phytocyanin domain-containing protein n=1 Tax=Fraxinus pennsylvanica TaxID=56036 RepID=A0AAD2DKH0_9LAMI|nr:unnamed protein product [Fraxinus pennsylvanica]
MASFSRSLCFSLGLFIIFSSFSEARDHLMGGKSDAWKVPSSESDSLNHWAEKTRFQVDDSLGIYTVKTYTDGNTKVKLERSGPYYFISGANGHCEKGQQVIVVVMSEKHRRFIGVSPLSSSAEVEGPAVAPTSNAANLKGSFLVALGALVGFLLM